MLGFREQDRVSAKGCKFLEHPSKYKVFNKDSAALS
jgi:hypothetical protein